MTKNVEEVKFKEIKTDFLELLDEWKQTFNHKIRSLLPRELIFVHYAWPSYNEEIFCYF